MSGFVQPDQINIRQQGTRVLLIKNGVLIADLPWQKALAVAQGLIVQARKAEELAKAERIIQDQALLLRAGAPFGLTTHPAILREAAKEAEHNRVLRRYLPGGIKSQEAVGTPTILQQPPSEKGSQ